MGKTNKTRNAKKRPQPTVIGRPLTLEDLVGIHTLYGVDRDPREDAYRDADIIRFMLGGTTYEAVEDACDGYRSTMDHIAVSSISCVNLLRKPVKVIARMSADVNNETILELLHAKTGNVILRVGTDNISDYYPSFVATFNSENVEN